MIGWLPQPRGRHASAQAPGAAQRHDPQRALRPADRHEARLDQLDQRLSEQDARTRAIFDWLRGICEETGVTARPTMRVVPEEEDEEEAG